MVAPAMNINKGITRSHVEKPSHSLCLKNIFMVFIQGLLAACAKSFMRRERATKQNRSKPRRASKESNLFFIELYDNEQQ